MPVPFLGQLALALAPGIANKLGGGDEQTQKQTAIPQDQLSLGRLGAEGGQEAQLAQLQQALFQLGAGDLLGGGVPNELSAGSIASGQISRSRSRALDDQAFGGLNEGLRRAQSFAGEQAASRGIGLSSIEGVQAAELQRPLIAQAGQLRAGLQTQELGRLSGLRQNLLGNIMRLQNSPALSRLMQVRQGNASQVNMTRLPGGLPDFTKDLIERDGGVGGGFATASGSASKIRADFEQAMNDLRKRGGKHAELIPQLEADFERKMQSQGM